MMRKRPPKKTESLEVRLPHALKQAFMAAAKERDRSASAVLRGLIESYLADPTTLEDRPMLKRYIRPVAATTLAASALALYALTPTAVAAAPDLKGLFDELDRDGNGTISVEEFTRRHEGDVIAFRHDDAGGAGAKPFMIPLKAGAHPPHVTPLTAQARAMLRSGFEAQDADGSGAVSFGEFESHHLAMLREGFDSLDTDRSGSIEPAEYAAATEALPAGPAAPVMPFHEADTDRDGKISWSEFLG